ncbi:carboxylating nicotinate-nucleotide diphosphorylase [Candidatus Halobonum tyrrellensis]|uniref:Nicotinate-nucleotide pyrophosphorylase [carboxylating] n=1 Tax=Candidatus Halobonum tyrrellensis G22 TaxID=1324957 RepID=V4HAW5_9EURY|nr:carboxylating nicotinate-nucleotide diphosphorylase [Candidatus Halobonum tyrrellensis]ESP87820.1 nicotinate-nucleotide pyrophosphorylase [Candidatus Halobonum tyrrellensis G22]
MLTESTVESWLAEDLGHRDVTNDVPGETTGRLVAREAGTVAGLDAAVRVFDYLGVDAAPAVETGDRVESGDAVLRVEGPARGVLRGERVAVNVAGHASGVATATRAAVDAAREVSDSVEIAATRKTTPGLRGVEKRAVAAGGGDTHRLDLSQMVMVKENHVAELGLEPAVRRFRERASFATKVEVEVEAPADGARAAEAGADVVLFDNMAPAEVERGVGTLPEGTLAEASGGIELGDVPAYAATGADVVSMGSLTHSAPSLDYSFRTG